MYATIQKNITAVAITITYNDTERREHSCGTGSVFGSKRDSRLYASEKHIGQTNPV